MSLWQLAWENKKDNKKGWWVRGGKAHHPNLLCLPYKRCGGTCTHIHIKRLKRNKNTKLNSFICEIREPVGKGVEGMRKPESPDAVR